MTTQRATCWSVTINNPTPADEEEIAVARQKGWKVEGQLEKGDGGTLHYQLSVKTPQVRFSAVKKAFSRGHIEQARNVAALEQYVSKLDTRVAPLAISQDRYPSQGKYFELLWEIILADTTNASEYRRPQGKRFSNPKHAMIKATAALIRQGYYVENIAANPMTSYCWDLWHDSILHRWQVARQTDTSVVQTSEINIPTLGHNNANSEEDSHDDQENGLLSGRQTDAVSQGRSPSSGADSSSNIHRDDCSSSEDSR